MRIGIFGGTFNPPHLGHVTMAEKAVSAAGLDRLIIMPNRTPPHKPVADMFATGEQRLEMCRLAFGGMPCTEVSDWELKQEGWSYSIYTLMHFHELMPGNSFWFVMGSDMLLTFHQWHRYKELLGLCGLVCVSREPGDIPELENAADRLREQGGNIIIARAEPFEASSSQVRERLIAGEDCGDIMGEETLGYIRKHKLYV